MTLVRDNATSLYSQIAARLRDEIQSGHFEPSGRLPSEAEIGSRFSVSRVTVRLALDDLARSGMIERRKGKGTFVAGKQVRHELDTLRSFHESLLLQGLDASMRILSLETLTIAAEMPAALRGAWSACLVLTRLHLVDNESIALGRTHLPVGVARIPQADMEARPAYSIVSAVVGQEVEKAHITIGAQTADPDLETVLGVRKGAALLVMERLSWFTDGTIAEQSTFYVRPERYRFVLNSSFRKP